MPFPPPSPASARRRAVFIDKDGTLVRDVPYNVDPCRVRLVPTAAAALRLLHAHGFRIVVVSNQAGVALGRFPETALMSVGARLTDLLAAEGVPLASFRYCPHHPAGIVPAYARACRCRKPAPGMLRQAAAELGLDLAASWMVGDILDDVEAGRRAGCRSILVGLSGETEWRFGPQRWPHFMVGDLLEAARVIVAGCAPARRPVAPAARMPAPRWRSFATVSP